MSFALMRKIDSFLGKPLIWVLGLFTRKARSLYGDAQSTVLPKRVVCTKFIGLGSVVLSLPLLKALKEAGVEVAFWSFSGQADIAKLSGFVDHVWVVRPTLRSFLPSLWNSWRECRRFRPDAFLDLEPTANFTAILSRLSGARFRMGFMSAKPLRESLFTHLVALTPERHMVENNLWMGRLLGVSSHVTSMLPAPPETVDQIPNPLEKNIPPEKYVIVVNVNSSDLSWHRMWIEDHWITLCKELLKDPEVELVFPGGRNERSRVQGLLEKLGPNPRIHNIAGQTSLLQLMRVLRASRLVVSVDSGIMHLASWMQVPVVGLFGPETPRLYAPRVSAGGISPVILWAALPCSPCLSVAADKITRCQDNQCMKKITPDRVLLACKFFMSSESKPKTGHFQAA